MPGGSSIGFALEPVSQQTIKRLIDPAHFPVNPVPGKNHVGKGVIRESGQPGVGIHFDLGLDPPGFLVIYIFEISLKF
jgi:hypothetical protein